MSESIDLSMDAYPTMIAMGKSPAYVRAVIGPAGSAKTSNIVKMLMSYAMNQAPDANGVRWTRWLVVRQTYQQLLSATLKSFQTFLDPIAVSRENPTPLMTIKTPLPDGTMVNSTIEFISMDKPDSLSKVLGYEPTGAFLDEISELSEDVIDAVVGRVGRFPSGRRGTPTWTGVLAATNGPLKSHWLYKWKRRVEGDLPSDEWKLYEQQTGRPFFELFRQPPALIRPTNPNELWQPNPAAENVENLTEGYGYYYKMLSQSENRIRAYVEGEFSELQTGAVVFPEFSPDLHRIEATKIPIPNGSPLLMSFDFGRTPVALAGVMSDTGQLIIFKEFAGRNMAVETLFDGYVKPWFATDFSKSRVVGAWGDPAGAVGGQGLELSPFAVLQDRNIPIEVSWDTANHLEPRLRSVRKRFQALDKNGKPMLLISSACPILLEALQTGYVYEAIRNGTGEVKDIPTKSHVNWVSDICDALQYMCLGIEAKYSKRRNNDDRIRPKSVRHLLKPAGIIRG